MIRVVHRLEKEGLRARLILQVHDELIVEAPEEEAPLVQQLLTEEMEQAIHLSVPMVAEATIGKKLGMMQKLKYCFCIQTAGYIA